VGGGVAGVDGTVARRDAIQHAFSAREADFREIVGPSLSKPRMLDSEWHLAQILLQTESPILTSVQFRYIPPAREEWRALFIQIAGSLFALLGLAWWQALQPHFNIALFGGSTLGVLYLLFNSAAHLNGKWRRSRDSIVELTPEALVLYEGSVESVVAWRQIKRCEAAGARVQVTWTDGEKERSWNFAPRDVMDGQTLARELKQRATPNFIALEAK
jgi:hypothetical protein